MYISSIEFHTFQSTSSFITSGIADLFQLASCLAPFGENWFTRVH